MLNITIICVGKLKERFYVDAANEYLKRLSNYCKPEVVEIREQRLPSEPSDAQIKAALEKERNVIQTHIPVGSFTLALCLEGRDIDSEGLSKLLSDRAGNGTSRLCFIIGGSFGLSDDLKAGVDFRLSLSKMTFPRSLARVILLEQLYRAYKIIEGGKYHK